MNGDLQEIWVYLATSPLFGLTLTLVAYQAATWVHQRAGQRAALNPVLIAVLLAGLVLTLTSTEYQVYFEGAQFVHFLLGPATVALAVPLHRHLPAIRRAAGPLLVAVVVGSLTAVVSTVALAWALGASNQTVVSLAPKSATAPVAMGIAEQLGGAPSLTAVFTILTGITGAVCGTALLDLLRVREPSVRGLAVGVASHGIGTARKLQLNPTSGAYAGLGLAMNAVMTTVLVPLLFTLVPPLAALVS